MSPTIEYRMDHPQSLLCKRISFVSIISLNSINPKPKIDFSHLFRIWSITPLARVFKLLASNQFWTIRMLRLKTRLKISNTFFKNTFQSKLFPSLKWWSYMKNNFKMQTWKNWYELYANGPKSSSNMSGSWISVSCVTENFPSSRILFLR